MQSKIPKFYVVLGPGHGKCAGVIRGVPLAENIGSPLVDFKDGIPRVSTREEKAKTGTQSLESLFAEDGHPERFEAYVKFREAIVQGRAVKPFPDSLLPKKVLEWRAAGGQTQEPFDAEAYLAEKAGKPAAKKADEKKVG